MRMYRARAHSGTLGEWHACGKCGRIQTMKMNLPKDVENIIEKLESAGFEAYAVGGCVRDTMLGKEPKDWDITTSAKPELVKELFGHTIDTGIVHGTVTVMQNHTGYEVTTYRIDGEYEDARHPKEVIFTASLEEDLKRRDFTINAMAYSPKSGLVDLFEGEKDLERGIIRCVGVATERFTEDALRMLRAIRFSAQLGFVIEERTGEAIYKLAATIGKISAERIATELIKTITSDHPDYFLRAYELGLTRYVLPEFDRMMATPQNNKHHKYCVGEHSIVSMTEIAPEKNLRLAMLLHDVAKPLCVSVDEKGEHYYGHPELGAKMAVDIMKRLKLDNDTIAKVKTLILYHDDRPEITPKSVRRMMNRIGVEFLPNLILVKRADVLAQSEYKQADKLAYIDALEKAYLLALENEECVSVRDLKIDGKDLLKLGLSQGKAIGDCLKYLLEQVLENPKVNEKAKLEAEAQKWMKEN